MSPTAAGSIKSSAGPVILLVVILTPVPLAPVDNLEKVAIPVLFKLPLPSAVLIPVKEDPSPTNVFAVIVPDAVILQLHLIVFH